LLTHNNHFALCRSTWAHILSNNFENDMFATS